MRDGALHISGLKSSNCHSPLHGAKTGYFAVHEKANWLSPHANLGSWFAGASGLLGKLRLAIKSWRYAAEFRAKRDEWVNQSI